MEQKETIKIKYLNDNKEGRAHVDAKIKHSHLLSRVHLKKKKGEFAMIHLGIAMQLPAGYEACVIPRSSTYKNFGIIQSNHMGLIDETYCGPNDWWRMPVIAMRDTEIHVNDRICQFRIQKHQPKIVFDEVEELTGEDRGGFGSTGRK